MSDSPKVQNGRIPELDGLRGLAIGLVLVAHYIFHASIGNMRPGTLASRLIATTALTWVGVDLFFVLSGFLIGGILMDAKGASNYFKTFYLRRLYRIFPLYFLMCGLVWLAGWSHLAERFTSLQWLYGQPPPWYILVSFTQNYWAPFNLPADSPLIGVTWSLAVEEQFYLTLPLLIRYVKRETLLKIALAVVIIAPLLRVFVFLAYPEGRWMAYMFMPMRADALMLGVIGAVLVRNPAGLDWLSCHRRALRFMATGLFLMFGLFTFKKWSDNSLPMASIGYGAFAVLFLCILLLAVTNSDSAISRFFRLRPLTELGVIAYGVYLFHVPIQALCFAGLAYTAPRLSNFSDLLISFLALLLTVVFAKASWLYFERPLVKRSHRHTYIPFQLAGPSAEIPEHVTDVSVDAQLASAN